MKKLMSLALGFVALLFLVYSEGLGYTDPYGGKRPFSNHSNAIVRQWNAVSLDIMQGDSYNPLMASRIFAMVHLAIHDALNGIIPVYDTYALQERDNKADPIAAVSAAAHTVLLESFPDKREQLDAALTNSLKDVKAGDARARGIALGILAGKAILAGRANDGAFQNPVAEVKNPLQPGLFQAVPPMPIQFAEHWKILKPFGLSTPHQFRVIPMPSLTSSEYATAFNEVKTKGVKGNSTRTAEETAIAKFWYEFSEIGWNRVTAVVVENKNLDLHASARVFALVNMGLADAYIAGWDSKFHHNFWRPYTAIRAASTDGNPNTGEDLAWEPLMNTPPIHDYPSTHSALGNAAATVLNHVIGVDTGFSMSSTSADPGDTKRSFLTFSQAAKENANSRVLAGLHFRFSCNQGLVLGADIGRWVVEHHLKPRSGGGL